MTKNLDNGPIYTENRIFHRGKRVPIEDLEALGFSYRSVNGSTEPLKRPRNTRNAGVQSLPILAFRNDVGEGYNVVALRGNHKGKV